MINFDAPIGAWGVEGNIVDISLGLLDDVPAGVVNANSSLSINAEPVVIQGYSFNVLKMDYVE